MYKYKAVVTNVIDGDTFDVDVDLGFHVHINVRIRILGVDTYEKRLSQKTNTLQKQWGLQIAEYCKKKFLGQTILIESWKANNDLGCDAYGRWLAYVSFGENFEDKYEDFVMEHYFDKSCEEKGAPIFD